jgi:hypothetical protein
MNFRYCGLGLAALSLTALGSLALPLGALAQDATTDQTGAGGATLPKTPVTLNVESADLYYTLKLLFSQIKADFTLDTSLRGTPVTVKLTKVPFDIALNAVLKASGQPLTFSFENGIFSIVPQTQQVDTTLGQQPNQEPSTQDLTKNTKYLKLTLNVVSVEDVMMALGRPTVQTNMGFSSGGGMGGGFGGGFGGGGMGGMGGGMGGMMGGMGGMGGGMMGGMGGGMMGGMGGGMGGGFGGGGGRGF